MTILLTLKTAVGVEASNTAFDEELLLFTNSAASAAVQIGVDELDIVIDETTEWPSFAIPHVENLVKHLLLMKVKQSFDPTASDTISRAISNSIMETEGRIRNEIEEAEDVA